MAPSSNSLYPERQPTRRRSGASAKDGVIQDQNDYGADYGNEHAIEVQPGHTALTHRIEEPTADKGSDDSENDVQNDALPGFVDQLTGDESRDESEDDPGNK
jgi:hypothetical protein